MASEDVVQQLEEQLETINRYRETELISRGDWGSIKFTAAQRDIETALSIAADLLSMPLAHLTDQAAQDIMAHVPGVAKQLERIDEFKLEGAPPEPSRDDIVSQLTSALAYFHTAASQWLPYLAYKRGDFTARIKQFEDAIAHATAVLEESGAYAKGKQDEVDRIVDAAREASASAGVGTFTTEFSSEADELLSASKKWLWGVGGLGLLTLTAALGSLAWPSLPDDASSWMTLRHVIAKVSVIAALFTGTVWCGRIYRALRHQRSINRHRALSLKTFQAFVKATDDPATRDAVLMAATKSIFSNVPTGFVDERAANQDASISVLEVGKSAGKALPRRPASAEP